MVAQRRDGLSNIANFQGLFIDFNIFFFVAYIQLLYINFVTNLLQGLFDVFISFFVFFLSQIVYFLVHVAFLNLALINVCKKRLMCSVLVHLAPKLCQSILGFVFILLLVY